MTVWLTVTAAAERAGASVQTIRRAIAAGQLKAYRLQPGGRLLRLRSADVDAWIATTAAVEISSPSQPGVTR